MQWYCKCKDWREGMKQIAEQAIFCSNHAGAPKYDAKVFKYCPWCRKKLSILKENNGGIFT